MPSLKDIRRRIRSVQSTQQITKAMEMVAAAKLRRSQSRMLAARPYAQTMSRMLESLAGAATERSDALFDVREVRRRSIVVIASDKGLCGSYNANVFRAVETALRGAERDAIDLIPIGRRATDYFRKRHWKGSYQIPELGDQLNAARAQALARHLIDLYKNKQTDAVEFYYTKFISTGSRRLEHAVFLPIKPEDAAEAAAHGAKRHAKDYIFEPSPDAIFGDLLPRYVQTRVMAAIAESLASEHSARLISMGAATKNAGEMIAALTLVRNRLRQAAITKEISELIGGAEALK